MPTTPTTCPTSFHDILDDLVDLGFCPMDTDIDGIFPAWVTTWRAENRIAMALTERDNVLTLSEYSGDDRWTVTLSTRSGVEIYSGDFAITRTGSTLMLALLAAAVTL